MDSKSIPANIQELHDRGQLSDDEYQLITLALKIQACRLRTDTLDMNSDRKALRFEITLVKSVK